MTELQAKNIGIVAIRERLIDMRNLSKNKFTDMIMEEYVKAIEVLSCQN